MNNELFSLTRYGQVNDRRGLQLRRQILHPILQVFTQAHRKIVVGAGDRSFFSHSRRWRVACRVSADQRAHTNDFLVFFLNQLFVRRVVEGGDLQQTTATSMRRGKSFEQKTIRKSW